MKRPWRSVADGSEPRGNASASRRYSRCWLGAPPPSRLLDPGSRLLDARRLFLRESLFGEKPEQDVLGNTRDVVVVPVVGERRTPANRPGREDCAATRCLEEDHVGSGMVVELWRPNRRKV